MRMFLEISLLIILVVILLCLVFYPVKIVPPQIVKHNQLSSVCFGNPPAGGCFQVELARTESERDQGLMYRKELDKNKGMLFIFDKESIYPFWMKNTLIPLDMIWADSNGKVVFISQNVQPCQPASLREALLAGKSLICPSVFPPVKAKYVLEINAGLCDKMGLKIGDDLKINVK